MEGNFIVSSDRHVTTIGVKLPMPETVTLQPIATTRHILRLPGSWSRELGGIFNLKQFNLTWVLNGLPTVAFQSVSREFGGWAVTEEVHKVG